MSQESSVAVQRKGVFIVIEGPDGSGKKTQAERVAKALSSAENGRIVEQIDFPQYKNNKAGRYIRECLDGKHGDFLKASPYVVSVFYANDRLESAPLIRSWLDQGRIVISDRYVSANQIHQGGKIESPQERQRFLRWLDHLEYEENKIPRPDVVVYLHLPLEVIVRKIKERAAKEGKPLDQAESNEAHLLASQQAAVEIVQTGNNWLQIDCFENGEYREEADITREILKKINYLLCERLSVANA